MTPGASDPTGSMSSESIPLYLVCPDGPARREMALALGHAALTMSPAEALAGLTSREPGVVVVPRGEVAADDILELAERVADAGLGWTLAVLSGADRTSLRVLSLGFPESVEAAAAYAADPVGAQASLLELRRVLKEMSRVRHDVNNPLTSALAETQLILFDAEDDDLRESMEVVQQQLRRIRDLVASTSYLRLPRKNPSGTP